MTLLQKKRENVNRNFVLQLFHVFFYYVSHTHLTSLDLKIACSIDLDEKENAVDLFIPCAVIS